VVAISYAVVFSGVALEICLLWRLLRKGLWRQYSCFFFYVFYVVIRTLALFVILKLTPNLWRSLYWGSESASVALRFLVIWEAFRHTFPKGSALNRILSRGLAVVAFGLIMFSVGTLWSIEAYSKSHSVFLALERSFDFAQALMILGVLLTARYYGLQLGRNIWGIAVAFGAHVSILTANNAMIDLTMHSFLPYWQVLSPLSFVAMLGIWNWAVWVYAPNPPIAAAEMAEQDAQLNWWEEGWNRTISAARRVMHS
jgi:hypothetical protein